VNSPSAKRVRFISHDRFVRSFLDSFQPKLQRLIRKQTNSLRSRLYPSFCTIRWLKVSTVELTTVVGAIPKKATIDKN
jgi:hypothetical protein